MVFQGQFVDINREPADATLSICDSITVEMTEGEHTMCKPAPTTAVRSTTSPRQSHLPCLCIWGVWYKWTHPLA